MDQIAARYRLDHHLYTLPLEFETLCELIRKENYDLISYDEIEKMGSQETFAFQEYRQKDAYTITDNETRIVCYDNHLSYEERNFALAHELGHIVLNHTNAGVRGKSVLHTHSMWYDDEEEKDIQEEEADEFALNLLAPSCIIGFIFPENVPLRSDIHRLTLLPEDQLASASCSGTSLRFHGRSKLTSDQKKLLRHYCIDHGIEPYEKMIDRSKEDSLRSNPVYCLMESCFWLAAGIAMTIYAMATI